MKILLVMPHPTKKRDFFARFTYPSLTLKQLAAIIPNEHTVDLVDERFEPINFNNDYDAVGISSLTYNTLRGYELADSFRSKGIPVFYGGYHASLLPDEVKQHADSVLIGEAELTLPQLLQDIEQKKMQAFYRPERFVEPEEIPAARHDIGSYNPFTEPIQASRGCPTGCEFCAMNVVEGQRFRGRPVDHIVNELHTIQQKSIFFADASLTISPPYTKALFKGLAPFNKQLECFGNINVLSRDDEFLKLASDAGVLTWYVGIESISQQNIDQAGKGTNKVENYGNAIKKIQDHGMMITGFFMFGFDHDTTDTFKKTLELIYQWDLDEVSFSIVTPYPGTRLFNRFEQEGRILCRDWSRYGEGNVNYKLEHLTEQELLQGIKDMAMDYYSLPHIIQRSFRHTNHSIYRMLSKFIRNYAVRRFYIKEKLTI
jgi:radical SAM superfamily enzyme YgiQ (UPF0313 family)